MKRIIINFLVIIFIPIGLLGQSAAPDSVPISLGTALQEALANNDQLKTGRAVLISTQAGLNETEGAFLPKLNGNFNYGYLDIVPGFKKMMLGNIEHDIFPSISLKQTIYAGGKLRHSKQAALANVHTQEFQFQNQVLGLKATVALRYYQLSSIHNQIDILKKNKEQLQVHQQYARLLVEAGRMSELELNRLSVEIATVDGKLLKLRNDYKLTSNELSVLLGRDQQQTFIPSDSLKVEPLSLDTTRIVQTAFDKNPLWKKFDWELRKAEQQIRIQQAARLPQVSATAWYGYEFGLESFAYDKNDRYFVGLNASMPIFDGGVIRAKEDQAKSKLESIQWQRSYFKKSLVAQVRNLYLRVKEMEAQIDIQQQAIVQARQSYRLALIEYHAGRRSNTDLLDIQKSLLNSELTLNEAIVNFNKSKTNLLYLVGTL